MTGTAKAPSDVGLMQLEQHGAMIVTMSDEEMVINSQNLLADKIAV